MGKGARRIPNGVEAGRGTYFASHPRILFPGQGKLRIGSYTSIGHECLILLGGKHHIERLTTYNFSRWDAFSRGDVTIGSDCWLGYGVTVLSGVTIGHGAVCGARAVVARDVPPYAIIVGNPANVVRYRFPREAVKELLRIAW